MKSRYRRMVSVGVCKPAHTSYRFSWHSTVPTLADPTVFSMLNICPLTYFLKMKSRYRRMVSVGVCKPAHTSYRFSWHSTVPTLADPTVFSMLNICPLTYFLKMKSRYRRMVSVGVCKPAHTSYRFSWHSTVPTLADPTVFSMLNICPLTYFLNEILLP